MSYTSSPYPEDYPSRTVFKGVNIYNVVPNRYPYMYDQHPVNSLYSSNSRVTPKPFPYTNRPASEHQVFGKPVVYNSLLDDRNLRPAYTFYL